MTQTTSPQSDDLTWLIIVPKRAEFSEPLFHFGERVKFCQGQGRERSWETGRITGMKFDASAQWSYSIALDLESPLSECGVEEVTARQAELQLVKDSCTLRSTLEAQLQWFNTAEAAEALNVKPGQLRKLRLNGMFKIGHHYRDTSVPGSGLPRWQWHVERCTKALSVPPEQRAVRSRRNGER